MWNLNVESWNYLKNETTAVIAKCYIIHNAPVIIPMNRLIVTCLQGTMVRKTRGTLNSVRRVGRTMCMRCMGHWTVWDVCNVPFCGHVTLHYNGMCHNSIYSPTITPPNIAIKVCDTKWCKLVMLPVPYCTFYEFHCSYMDYLKALDIMLLCVIVKPPGVVFFTISHDRLLAIKNRNAWVSLWHVW